MYTIEKQIISCNKNIGLDYLNNNIFYSFKYKIKESDGTKLTPSTIQKYYNIQAKEGQLQIHITFANDSYFNDFNKTFTINLTTEKK